MLAELGDAAKAKQAAIEQMKGKTFPVYLANYQPLITAVLEQAGLALEDVKTINFADDEKAALAFIGGEGEFYMGGLPSEINLLMNHPDQFKLIGGAEILGPGRPLVQQRGLDREVAGRRTRTRPSRSWPCPIATTATSRKRST